MENLKANKKVKNSINHKTPHFGPKLKFVNKMTDFLFYVEYKILSFDTYESLRHQAYINSDLIRTFGKENKK